MGTRSLTVITYHDTEEDKFKDIVVMYRQMDGYPEGLGSELKSFLEGFKIVNGFNTESGKAANGMECLAAQLIAHFKDGIGSVYLHPAGTRDCGAEWIYTIYPMADSVGIGVHDVYKNETIYHGSVTDFDPKKLTLDGLC